MRVAGSCEIRNLGQFVWAQDLSHWDSLRAMLLGLTGQLSPSFA